MYVNFKDKGIDFAKQAVAEDEAGNYEKALQLYLASLEYFKTYLKYEKNQKAKEAITAKASYGSVMPNRNGRSCRLWLPWHAALIPTHSWFCSSRNTLRGQST